VEAAAATFPAGDSRPVKLFFEDEGRFGRMGDPFPCWAPHGERPVVAVQLVRQYTHVFSAVCPRDGQSLSLVLPYADTPAMKIFLQECSEQWKDYRVIMVMDKAAWHRSTALGEFENIRIIHQPSYSPELNPVEHFWEYIRERYLRNYLWTALSDLEDVLASVLKALMESADMIRSVVGFHWAII
jgi:hypothetical protein